jgi:hypothetical protein
VANLVDFARTSSFVSTTSGPLTYVPSGRDAIGFAYYAKAGVTPVTSLTKAQLLTLYTDGQLTVGSTRIIPCGIQTGSGTFQFWNQFVQQNFGSSGQSFATENAATAECRNLVTASDDGNGRLQESKIGPLKDKGDVAPANTQVIVGYSVGNFIAQQNLRAEGIPAGVRPLDLNAGGNATDLGIISDTFAEKGYDLVGAGPNVTPDTGYYATNAGRFIGYVLSTTILTEPGELELKAMFTNDLGEGLPTNDPNTSTVAVICSTAATTTLQLFGFAPTTECGTTSRKGPYVTPSSLPLS